MSVQICVRRHGVEVCHVIEVASYSELANLRLPKGARVTIVEKRGVHGGA